MSEFDAYAPGYSAGMEHPLKRLLGRNADQFVDVKVRWLLDHLAQTAGTPDRPRLLDYGCGTGALLRALARRGFRGTMVGCDASPGMLAEAVKGWEPGQAPPFHTLARGRAPVPDGGFDVVVLSAVLHHTPPEARDVLLADAARVRAPHGRLVIFEHNPLNPVTRWVVRRTPIDRHAVLVHPRELRQRVERLGLGRVTTRFLMFFPPRLSRLSAFERRLARLPLGAQYVVVAEGPAA